MNIKSIFKILYSCIIIALILFAVFEIGYTSKKPYFGYLNNKQYSKDYNCQNFSNDLVKILEDKEIQAEVTRGYLPDGTPHSWVGVWIEPQTGEFTKGYRK